MLPLTVLMNLFQAECEIDQLPGLEVVVGDQRPGLGDEGDDQRPGLEIVGSDQRPGLVTEGDDQRPGLEFEEVYQSNV